MNEHRPEVADVFRTYDKEFFARWGHVLNAEQRKAFVAIRDCRAAALGGHGEYVDQCDECGHRVIAYNSCRKRRYVALFRETLHALSSGSFGLPALVRRGTREARQSQEFRYSHSANLI